MNRSEITKKILQAVISRCIIDMSNPDEDYQICAFCDKFDKFNEEHDDNCIVLKAHELLEEVKNDSLPFS